MFTYASWLEEISRRHSDLLAAQDTIDKLQERERVLCTEIESTKVYYWHVFKASLELTATSWKTKELDPRGLRPLEVVEIFLLLAFKIFFFANRAKPTLMVLSNGVKCSVQFLISFTSANTMLKQHPKEHQDVVLTSPWGG